MTNNVKLITKEMPMNFGPLKNADANACITGPCGDTMWFWLKINNDKIVESKYTTDGCENSIICGSVTANLIKNKNLEEAYFITQKQVLSCLSFLPPEDEHCALLAVNTVKKAIEEYKFTQRENCSKNNQCDNNCNTCSNDSCNSSTNQQNSPEKNKTQNGQKQIKRKIAILSGKGGVGKSTIAVNLASTLALSGFKVGLMDVDIHGPSIPTLLNLSNFNIQSDCGKICPIEIGNLKVISIGFFLANKNDALIWRGPVKIGIINQFLNDVKWGELDFLVIDLPPGTGDESLSIGQAFTAQDSAIIVTTPQEVSTVDVRKSINFCHKLGLSILGIIENMSVFICPKCGEMSYIFGSGGGKNLSENFDIPLLGQIPIDPEISFACDKGEFYLNAFSQSKTAIVFRKIIDTVIQRITNKFTNHSSK